MKRGITSFLIVFMIVYALPLQFVDAAKAITVKTKVHSYKGQQYVQITGGDKKIVNKINQALKQHALNAARSDAMLKKDNKDFWYKTTVNTKYNKNDRLSVVYYNSFYSGGAHDLVSTTSFNYDLTNGYKIRLADIASSEKQITNLFDSVSKSLLKKYQNGDSIFEDNIYDFPLTPNSNFYYYDKGIVIRFDPYAVGPFSRGPIDIQVPFTDINKAQSYVSPINNNNATSGTAEYIEARLDDTFEGFDEGNIYKLDNGQIWMQVSYDYAYSYQYRPDVIISKVGSRYFMIVADEDEVIEVERLK